MSDPSTSAALTKALRAARETRALEIGAGTVAKTAQVFRQQFGSRPAVIVSDENTFRVAGGKVTDSFRNAGHDLLEPFIFRAPDLYAENRFVVELEAALKKHEAIPVAVGSGTINDLTKLAAHRAGRPYMAVATAASMDGYTAFGASITFEGSKQTFLCPAPTAVVADLDIICGAPAIMNAWGYADLLAKVTAGADWIVADALGVEPIDPAAWEIVQSRLLTMVADAPGIRAARPEAIAQLTEGLMLGGFAMQATKTSRSASGAEHQFSHLWDMQHHTHNGHAPSHGFKVGIGTLAVTALYERLLAQPLDKLDVERCCAAWPNRESWLQQANAQFAEGELRAVAVKEISAKADGPEVVRQQLTQLRLTWPGLKARLQKQLISFAELRKMLQDAGAPVEPEEVGISRARLRDSFRQAFFIRRRFTVLDLAVRAGLLEGCVNEIFGPHGPWPLVSSAGASE